MTKWGARPEQRVVGSTDVYSRKHIDKQHDRLDRRVNHAGDKARDLKARVRRLESIIQKLATAHTVSSEEE